MSSRRRYYIFVGLIYGLEEKSWKSEVVVSSLNKGNANSDSYQSPRAFTARVHGSRLGAKTESLERGFPDSCNLGRGSTYSDKKILISEEETWKEHWNGRDKTD